MVCSVPPTKFLVVPHVLVLSEVLSQFQEGDPQVFMLLLNKKRLELIDLI